jgi:hypothetical protein
MVTRIVTYYESVHLYESKRNLVYMKVALLIVSLLHYMKAASFIVYYIAFVIIEIFSRN